MNRVDLVASVERATHMLGLHLQRSLADLGITQAEAHVLGRLARADGPLSIGELHRAFGHRRSTLTAVLDRLEGRRYVRRVVSSTDRRSVLVSTTASGKRAASRVAKVLDGLESAVARRCSARDIAGFAAVVDAVAAVTDSS